MSKTLKRQPIMFKLAGVRIVKLGKNLKDIYKVCN